MIFEEVVKDVTEPALPYVWRAELANSRFDPKRDPEQTSCAGKGMTAEVARATALGEAVERYSSGCWEPGEVVHAARPELAGPSLHPRDLVLFRPDQYGGLPYAPYADDTVMGWVPARSLASGGEVLVPALAVFMSYHAVHRGEYLCPVTSNGLAAGPNPARSVLSGLLEVLERDAFLVTWMNRLPVTAVDPATHPDPDVVGLWRGYDRRRVRLSLFRLPTDHPAHVFMALAVDEGDDGPAAVIGMGADLDPARAAAKAALEVAQIRPALRMSLRIDETKARVAALVADPHLVADIDDHNLLYTDRRSLPRLSFLLDRPLEPFDWSVWAGDRAPGAGPALTTLVDHLAGAGTDVLTCDLTPPELARLGLYTARVIVPGFQPIHFGWTETRLAGHRLFDVPCRLGFTDAPTTPADLNDDPHPLA
ncbi:MAG: YcaO-like family protein [Acidimicrobiales bacterium]